MDLVCAFVMTNGNVSRFSLGAGCLSLWSSSLVVPLFFDELPLHFGMDTLWQSDRPWAQWMMPTNLNANASIPQRNST